MIKTDRVTLLDLGESIEEHDLVEFRLIYHGVLPSSAGSTKHSAEKHKIRRVFHPQLRRLWTLKPGLVQLAQSKGQEAAKNVDRYKDRVPAAFTQRPEAWFYIGLLAMGDNWNRNGFNFVPLITEKIAVRCSIDILLLRPGDRKYILEQSDIDGQLKTLFDALRIPKDSESVDNALPTEDEKPFYCLLEDDRLISEVHVLSDELLLLPGESEVKANHAYVVMHVRVNHVHPGPFDQWYA